MLETKSKGKLGLSAIWGAYC